MADENNIFTAPQEEPEFKKERRRKQWKEEAGGGLNINSLMDIMTILLVFLLVSMTSDPLNITLSSDLVLAKSTADYNPEDSIPVTVTKRHVLADKKAVVKVSCKVGGQMCSEEDFELLAHCEQKPEECTPEEKNRADNMYFYIDKSFKEDGSDEKFLISPLQKELERLVREQKEENLKLQREYKGVATIICDRDIPFRMIAEIVHTAGMAELHDLRFAIIKSGAR
jgi:hypothetical protein